MVSHLSHFLFILVVLAAGRIDVSFGFEPEQVGGAIAQCATESAKINGLLEKIATGQALELGGRCSVSKTVTPSDLDRMRRFAQEALQLSDLSKTPSPQLIRSFAKDIFLRSMSNLLITRIDAEMRYPQAAVKEGKPNIGALFDELCRRDGTGLGQVGNCMLTAQITNSDKQDLISLGESYVNAFRSTGQKTFSIQDVRNDLNSRTERLRAAVAPKPSTQPKLITGPDLRAGLIEIPPQSKKAIEVELSDAPGILLYSDALADHLGGKKIGNDESIRDAIDELKRGTRDLAGQLNIDVGWATGLDKNKVESASTAWLERMLVSNPVAVGQVLANKPEYRKYLCHFLKRIEETDVINTRLKATSDVMLFATMIVGAVAITPELFALKMSEKAIERLAGVRLLNGALSNSAFAGAIGQHAFSALDLRAEEISVRQSILAQAGANSADLQKVYDAQKENLKQIAFDILYLSVPKAAAQVGKIFAPEVSALVSRLPTPILERFIAIEKLTATNAQARAGMNLLKLACAVVVDKCGLLISGFQGLRSQAQLNVLKDEKSVLEFVNKTLEKTSPTNSVALKKEQAVPEARQEQKPSQSQGAQTTEKPQLLLPAAAHRTFGPENPRLKMDGGVVYFRDNSKLIAPGVPYTKSGYIPTYEYERKLSKQTGLEIEEVVGVTRNFSKNEVVTGQTGVFQSRKRVNGTSVDVEEINGDFNLIGAYRKGMSTIVPGQAKVQDFVNMRKDVAEIEVSARKFNYKVLPDPQLLSGKVYIPHEIPNQVLGVMNFYGIKYSKNPEGGYFVVHDQASKMPMLEKFVSKLNGLVASGASPEKVVAVAVQDYIVIHPYDDGNGRTARLYAQILYKKMTGKTVIFPLEFHKEMSVDLDRIVKSMSGPLPPPPRTR